jgi:hypothetical protein
LTEETRDQKQCFFPFFSLCAFHTAANFFAKNFFSKFYLSKKNFFEGVETYKWLKSVQIDTNLQVFL